MTKTLSQSVDVSRQLAFTALARFEKSGAERLKADSVFQDAVAAHKGLLSDQDRAFSHALVMGTLRHWLRLDEWIKLLTERKLKQITPQVRVLLRMGLFQLYGLGNVPAYAAINSTVELAKSQKTTPKTVKFINAVLREAQRRLESGGFPVPSADENLPSHLLWDAGWPESWTQLLLSQYEPAELLAMAKDSQASALLSIRVNTLKTDTESFKERLTEAGIAFFEPDPALPEALQLREFVGSPRQLPGYAEGWFYVQDASSLWVSYLLQVQPGHSVLDLCAAPGSKTTHMAALMNNEGRITALEPKKERLALLHENIERLGVQMVETVQADALTWDSAGTLYDRVLVDAPCSGSGTLRKHPEILLHLRKLDLASYTALQLKLLRKGFDCLKPGGALVYSTCSLLQAENQDVVAQFLKQHGDAHLEFQEQRLINENADGFYAARIIKKS